MRCRQRVYVVLLGGIDVRLSVEGRLNIVAFLQVLEADFLHVFRRLQKTFFVFSLEPRLGLFLLRTITTSFDVAPASGLLSFFEATPALLDLVHSPIPFGFDSRGALFVSLEILRSGFGLGDLGPHQFVFGPNEGAGITAARSQNKDECDKNPMTCRRESNLTQDHDVLFG